jgi:hypothetical protein
MRIETEPVRTETIFGYKVEVFYDPIESRLAPVKQYRVYVDGVEVALVENYTKKILTDFVREWRSRAYTLYVLTIGIELGREFAEGLESRRFKSFAEFWKEAKELDERANEESVDVLPISEFAEACNNEEIGLVENWVSYVLIKETFGRKIFNPCTL